MNPDARRDTDIAIIGAGPTGLAAAATAAASGVRVTLIDEQPEPGGQIYRSIGSTSEARLTVLGADYAAGATLLNAVDAENVSVLSGATVWEVTHERTIFYSIAGQSRQLQARCIIVATGAIERPMPIPGWTLPGVMTAGAAQILLKRSGLLPAQPVVLAGSGPLLYLMAVQLLAAGVKPAAIVDTTPARNRQAALRHLPSALAGHKLLRKGLALLLSIRRSGLVYHRGVNALEAHGDGRVQELTFTTSAARQTVPCTTLLLHTGVVPNVQISRSLGLEHRWDASQWCWRPVLDDTGRTAIDGIWIAGDGAGISGAEAAVPAGRLAAMAAVSGICGATPADTDGMATQRTYLQQLNRVRPFLEALYAPPAFLLSPADNTIVCRCEEVTAGQVREFVVLGCLGPNQAKSYGRCGMGPCQGRYCGLTVSHIIAEARGVPVSDVGYFRLRPPLKPVTLGELASLADDVGEPDRVG